MFKLSAGFSVRVSLRMPVSLLALYRSRLCFTWITQNYFFSVSYLSVIPNLYDFLSWKRRWFRRKYWPVQLGTGALKLQKGHKFTRFTMLLSWFLTFCRFYMHSYLCVWQMFLHRPMSLTLLALFYSLSYWNASESALGYLAQNNLASENFACCIIL